MCIRDSHDFAGRPRTIQHLARQRPDFFEQQHPVGAARYPERPKGVCRHPPVGDEQPLLLPLWGDLVVAVSYTHLDVYKRQGYN